MNHTKKSPSVDPPPATALIELRTITHDDGEFVVSIGGNKHRWQLRCKAIDVQTFARFQRVVADQLGLWIDHYSQGERRARDRSEDWNDSVRQAFDRGATA